MADRPEDTGISRDAQGGLPEGAEFTPAKRADLAARAQMSVRERLALLELDNARRYVEVQRLIAVCEGIARYLGMPEE